MLRVGERSTGEMQGSGGRSNPTTHPRLPETPVTWRSNQLSEKRNPAVFHLSDWPRISCDSPFSSGVRVSTAA